MIRHHLNPVESLENYNPLQSLLVPRADLDAIDFLVQNDAARRAEIASYNELDSIPLSDKEIKLLMDFLDALTDTSSIDLRVDVPFVLPSGLPVFD